MASAFMNIDPEIIKAVLTRIDYNNLGDNEQAKLDVMRSVLKTLSFLGMFSDEPIQSA